MSSKISRRTFGKATAGLAAAASLSSLGTACAAGANEKLNIALIGCGGMGQYKPFNPHVMLDDKGQVNLRNCLLCHRETSEVIEHKTRMGRDDLQDNPIMLCARCHSRHADVFEPGHIGRPVPPAIKAYMLAREDRGMGSALSADDIAPYLNSSRQPQRFPLGQNDRLVCSTCHNPHQEGLFPPNSPLGLGGMKVHVPNRPPEMRGLGKESCRGCHNK